MSATDSPTTTDNVGLTLTTPSPSDTTSNVDNDSTPLPSTSTTSHDDNSVSTPPPTTSFPTVPSLEPTGTFTSTASPPDPASTSLPSTSTDPPSTDDISSTSISTPSETSSDSQAATSETSMSTTSDLPSETLTSNPTTSTDPPSTTSTTSNPPVNTDSATTTSTMSSSEVTTSPPSQPTDSTSTDSPPTTTPSDPTTSDPTSSFGRPTTSDPSTTSDPPTTSDPSTSTTSPPSDTTTSPPNTSTDPDTQTTTSTDPPNTSTSDNPPDSTTSTEPPNTTSSDPPPNTDTTTPVDSTSSGPVGTDTTTPPDSTSSSPLASFPVTPTSTIISTESTASEAITITTSISGTMIRTVPPEVITTIWTTDANGGTSPVVVTIHQPTGNLSPGGNNASEEFFGNRGAVAGVFSFVGVAIVALIAGLWYALRRRRRQQRIRRAEQYAAGAIYPVHPLRDDDEYAERMRRRTFGHEMDGSDTPMLALPGTTSASGHGHFDTTDSSNVEMYEPYAGYGPAPSSLAPYAGIVSPPPQYVSGRASTPTPAQVPAAPGRPISPGYAAMLMAQTGASSHGHGSTSSHDSIGQALMTPYPYSSTGPASSVARDASVANEQQEPLLAYATDVKVRPTSPPLPPKNPNRPRPGSIALPPPGLPLPQMRSTTTDSEYPPSAYSADEDARLDPNLAGRLRGGSVMSSSTPSFRDDQDYSRRLSVIRQNTYDSYVSMPGNIPEAEHEPER